MSPPPCAATNWSPASSSGGDSRVKWRAVSRRYGGTLPLGSIARELVGKEGRTGGGGFKQGKQN